MSGRELDTGRLTLLPVSEEDELFDLLETASGRTVGRAGLVLRRCEQIPGAGFALEGSLEEEFRGRGLMTEAAGEILRMAFEGLHLPAVWCACPRGDAGSERLVRSLGFVFRCNQGEESCWLLAYEDWDEQVSDREQLEMLFGMKG